MFFFSPDYNTANDASNINVISPGQFQEYSDYDYNNVMEPNYADYPEESISDQGKLCNMVQNHFVKHLTLHNY